MRTWPMVLIVLTLLGSLVAATLVDAKTFTIPLVVPWTAGLAGVLIHPAHAAWLQIAGDGLPRSPFPWTIPVPHDWRWTAAVWVASDASSSPKGPPSMPPRPATIPFCSGSPC